MLNLLRNASSKLVHYVALTHELEKMFIFDRKILEVANRFKSPHFFWSILKTLALKNNVDG